MGESGGGHIGTTGSASASSTAFGQLVLNAQRSEEGEGVARRLFAKEPEIIPDKQDKQSTADEPD